MTFDDSLWVNALEQHADSLQRSMDSLQTKMDVLQAKNDLFCSVVESANDGVSNQLSATNNFLALIAVIVTIAAIWLGVVIEKRKRQIEIIAETVDGKKKEVESLAKATEDLNNKIHSDISGLYKDLRKEETKALFQRLAKEPLDIDNLGQLLLAREVDIDNFPLLKQAFLKLQKIPKIDDEIDVEKGIFRIKSDTNIHFMLQFFQHFFYHSVKDDDIRPVFVEYFNAVTSTSCFIILKFSAMVPANKELP